MRIGKNARKSGGPGTAKPLWRRPWLLVLVIATVANLAAIAFNARFFDGIASDLVKFVRHYSFPMNWATLALGAAIFWTARRAAALLKDGTGTEGARRGFALAFSLLLVLGFALEIQVQRLRTAGWLHWESEWKVGRLPVTGIEASAFRLVDSWSGGYLNNGYSFPSASWLLENHHDCMDSLHIHPHNKPPGGIIFMHSIISAVESLPASILQSGHNALLRLFPELIVPAKMLTRDPRIEIPQAASVEPLTGEQQRKRFSAYPLVMMLVVLAFSIVSVAAAIPLFFLARELLASAEQALWVAVGWLLLPGLLVLAPVFDQLYPLFSMVLLLTAVSARRLPWGLGPFLTGLWLAVCFFFSPIFFILIPLCPFLFVFPAQNQLDLRGLGKLVPSLLSTSLVFALGASLPYLVLYHLYGFDLVQVITKIHPHTAQGRTFDLSNLAWQWRNVVEQGERWAKPYLGALVFNYYELILSCGLPVFFLGVLECFSSVKRVVGGRKISRIDFYVIGTVGALLVMCVSGILDYEACRICLPLIPSFLIGAVRFLRRNIVASGQRARVLTALAVLQFLWILTLREFMILD